MKILKIRGFKNFTILFPSDWSIRDINDYVVDQEFWQQLLWDIETDLAFPLQKDEKNYIIGDNGRIDITLISDVDCPIEISEL